MDDNQFRVAIAIVSTIQVMFLAWLAYLGRKIPSHVAAIANGLTSAKDAAVVEAATKTGELRGRDYQAEHPLAEVVTTLSDGTPVAEKQPPRRVV